MGSESRGLGLAVVVALIATPVLLLLEGAVGSSYWNWFVAPAFNVPRLGLVNAVGISTMVSYWTHSHSVVEADAEKKMEECEGADFIMFRKVLHGVGFSLMIWGAGAILHLFA